MNETVELIYRAGLRAVREIPDTEGRIRVLELLKSWRVRTNLSTRRVP
jgi:hypothetical protein